MQITCGQSSHDEFHVVLDDHEASALLLVELQQKLAQLVDKARVDARTGLVKQNQPRGRHESHGDVDELLLPVRKIAGRQLGDVLQAEHLDHLIRVLAEPRVGLREQAARHGALEFLRRGDEVVAHR